ncbi:MAG: ABC transporter ATP-binding protein [Pseudomonadota bacterium]
MSASPVLSVKDYSLAYGTSAGTFQALQEVSLAVHSGEVLGLVGESGSGKTSLAHAIMRGLPPNVSLENGSILLGQEDLTGFSQTKMTAIRGRRLGMVFQDPSTSLNPTMTLGTQISEVLIRHRGLERETAIRESIAMLERVGLKTPDAMMHRYPHEVSGGEKQRVVIAAAFACQPEVLLFDEPTTALDVITARQILDLFRDLQNETGVASLYISHDLALVSTIADRVAVIHRGKIVEEDPAEQIFSAPQDAYTKRLISAVPRPDRRLVGDETTAPSGTLLKGRDLTVRYGRPGLLDFLSKDRNKRVIGAQSVSFDLAPAEILGIVGESGSGKSTIAKALVGLNPFTGAVDFDGKSLTGRRDMDAAYRRAVQIIFQHPDSSLNPRQTVGTIIARPLRRYGLDREAPVAETVAALLRDVQLPEDYARRYPHQLSGGEKQRVAIARAFASKPQIVICDEITSSLDVSVQASIIQLLLDLRERHGTAYLFITHDLNLVRQIAHRIVVMYRGDVVETASVAALARQPEHAYTKALLDAVPVPVG